LLENKTSRDFLPLPAELLIRLPGGFPRESFVFRLPGVCRVLSNDEVHEQYADEHGPRYP
jgi:hypothetical protein